MATPKVYEGQIIGHLQLKIKEKYSDFILTCFFYL